MGKLQKSVLALLAGMCVSPLWAADLSVKSRPGASPPPYLDAWDGWYAGGHIGWGADTGGGTALSAIPFSGVDVSVPQGVVGGVHLGYGQRFGGFFYGGIEGSGDISAVHAGGNGLITASSQNDWLASIRGRAGILFGQTMLYGTVGWGWSGGKFTLASPVFTGSMNPTLNGVTWGGGLESVLWTPQWTGRLEYLRYDFGSLTLATPVAMFQPTDTVQTITLGVSYHFAP